MAAKRDAGFGNARYTKDEEFFLRQCARAMNMENSVMIRKALALGLPLLVGNPFLRRVELEDTMNGLRESVNHLFNKRNDRA